MKTVTAAIIRCGGAVLLARRAPGQKLAGLWEFPGGKLEDGETLEQCLSRELMEELGLTSRVGTVFAETIYTYAHGAIHLVALNVEVNPSEEIVLSVHDRVEWVNVADVLGVDLAPADIAIATKLKENAVGCL